MRLQKIAGLFLGSAVFLSMAVPSFAIPTLTNIRPFSTRNRLPDLTINPEASGRISYHSLSSVTGVDCRKINIEVSQSIPNTSDYKLANSAQAQGDYQRDGFCTYDFHVPAIPSSSSYRTIANDGYWSGESYTLGGDLVLTPIVH